MPSATFRTCGFFSMVLHAVKSDHYTSFRHPMKSLRTLTLASLFTVAPMIAQTSAPFSTLHAEDYHHYVTLFASQEVEATHAEPKDEWPWMAANIPLFDASDKSFEEMYYFRWYAFEKHVVETKRGFVITEWLPKPDVADGFFGALPDAAPFHLSEARWLRNPKIANDYARYWLSPDGDPRKYSTPISDSVRNVALASGDTKLESDLLPAMIANYKAWDDHLDSAVRMYWQIDTRDAMEKSIGGDGYRTPLNSYQYADAMAIAAIATREGQSDVAAEYSKKATALRGLIDARLWNPKDQFYENLSPSIDSGIRKQKKFVNPGTPLTFSSTRELIGYIPWEFYLPAPDRAGAWKQLFDPQGFAGKYGPTTAERRSPRFRFESSDQCTWNGPAWPYADTQTLLALANLLNGPTQSYIGKEDYLQLFRNYVLSQHLTLPNGTIIDWIDEDLDADTDQWIAKTMLAAKNKQVGRGNYYNHSGFADPLITGLIGLRPREDELLELHPLLPAGAWTYFALDGLPYHGHLLAIVYDATGDHYHRGTGLTVFADGVKLANRATLGPLETKLPGTK